MVKAQTKDEAFAIRQRMRSEWEEKLLGVFERAFDEAAAAAGAEELMIHLGKLELDLRLASEREISGELPEMIYRQLGERLRAMIDDAGFASDRDRPRVSTPEEDRFETLVHYLRTGSLPWSAAGADDAAVSGELRETCRREIVRLAVMLRSGGADVALLFRLLQLFDESELPELVHALLDDAPGVEDAGIVRVIESLTHAAGDRHTRLEGAATMIAAMLRDVESGRAAAGDANDAGDEEEEDDADDLFGELDDLLEGLEEVSQSLEELQDLISGEGTRDILGDLFKDVQEEMNDGEEESGDADRDAVDRRSILRLSAALIAGGLRGASSASDIDEAVKVVFDLLIELDAADARVFVEALLGYIPQSWKESVARIVMMVIEADASALARPARMRIAAAILVESLRSAGRSAAPFFGDILDRHTTLEERDELRRLLASLPESILAMLGHDTSARREETDDSGDDAGARAPAMEPHGGDDGALSAHRFSTNGSAFPAPVPNAGLVLLHSFIPPLFANTGIIEAGRSEIAPSALPRAAAMLHFIATGRTEALEFELGLVKVLLGLTPEDPLAIADGLIGSGDIEEIESLLDAAIEYWSALKSTSRDALRDSFLKRRGLLRREGDGWRLQVEPASFDMLLGHLPWGISIIKLPWMRKPMHVEWERP